LTAVTALTETQLALMDETVKKINSDMKTGDGLMRAFADQSSSMSQKFVRAKGQMTVAFKRFVVLFAPMINKMIDWVALLAEKFANLSKPTKYVIASLLILAAVIPPLLIAFGALAFSISAIIAAGPALAVIGGVFALVAAPVWATAAALGAVAFAIAQIVTNWEALTAKGFLKDLAGWATGADPEAGLQSNSGQVESAAILKSMSRIREKKLEVSGGIQVSAAEGSKVDSSSIGLNTGHQLSGAGAGF
jgi:hypothetical protein